MALIHSEPWTPFERAVPRNTVTGQPMPQGLNEEWWGNSRFTVCLRRIQEDNGRGPTLIHLSIHCHDRCARHDWRELQRIKNELVGEDYEAVELYPARERTVDTANEYHLWVVDDPTFRFPWGFQERAVLDEGEGPIDVPGAKQRPLRKEDVL